MATPLSTTDEIHQRIADLQAELDSASPGIATHLLKIHAYLGKSPELLHFLTEEEISIIARGLQVQTGVQIIAAKAAAPSKKKESLKDLEI